MIAIGGLVKYSDEARAKYLDEIFYDHNPTAQIHLLGMIKKEWFEPYEKAVQGDNTSWIPRSEWNRKKSISEWMLEYGEQWMNGANTVYTANVLYAILRTKSKD